MMFREWMIKDTSAAGLFCHRLLVNGREFDVLCTTGGIMFRVRCMPHDMLFSEYPDHNWLAAEDSREGLPCPRK